MKWLVPEVDSPRALGLLADCEARGVQLVAPHLLPIEVTNVVRQHVRRGELTQPVAVAALDYFLRVPVTLWTEPDAERGALHRRAFAIAYQLNLRATYDAHYLALAEALGCELWTADANLVRQAADLAVSVRLLADYAPASL